MSTVTRAKPKKSASIFWKRSAIPYEKWLPTGPVLSPACFECKIWVIWSEVARSSTVRRREKIVFVGMLIRDTARFMAFLQIFRNRPPATGPTRERSGAMRLHKRGEYADQFDSRETIYDTLRRFTVIAPIMPSRRPKGFRNEKEAEKLLHDAKEAIGQGALPLARTKNAMALALCPQSLAAKDMKNYIDTIFSICEHLVNGIDEGKW